MDVDGGIGTDLEAEKRFWRDRRPGIGSFATIALAVLMLFGAASRLGKTPETASLFGLDSQSEQRIRLEEERLKALQIIGAVPRRPGGGAAPGVDGIDEAALPPLRNAANPAIRRQRDMVSLAVPENAWERPDSNDAYVDGGENLADASAGDDPEPAPAAGQLGHYVVAEGDTWVKIAQRTLGDAKRWRELFDANPAARNGLRVKMRLVVPN
ncbi:MAG: LysM peptidoglycan-binding domain-containing protein [Planctomycetota bacterium]|nr:LysM peptidoglycan-binding domain-containing protein [Planctomycetota bacterium]